MSDSSQAIRLPKEYGDIRVELELKGKIFGGNDMLIAARARQRGLKVVTNNT